MAGTKIPRDFSANWPDSRCTDPAAEAVRRFVVALLTATRGDLEHLMPISQLTAEDMSDLVSGETWPDMKTIATLEAVAGADLWPTRQ